MPRTLATAAILATALAAGTPAQAFTATNGLVVDPSGGDGFAVPWRGESAPSAFWCAAGDYVIRGLGLPPSTRVYRTSPVPRPRGGAVAFALTAEAAVEPGLLVTGSPDRGLSAAHARALCLEPRLDPG
ncbi:MAG: hypothetical protein N2422_06490 [Rhodobacteraceae bacterium]|nr:hypothetical protein [Paracoccaceae bacterium]